jgi:hypothetical protein
MSAASLCQWVCCGRLGHVIDGFSFLSACRLEYRLKIKLVSRHVPLITVR